MYDLPLFFVTVQTNVGYKVVTHFIVQSETTEQILEALNIIKAWKPQFFILKPKFQQLSMSLLKLQSTFAIFIANKHGPDGQEITKMGSASKNRKPY